MSFNFSLFSPKSPPLIGIDISSSAVKVLELSADGRANYRVERYAIEVLPKDAVLDGNIVDMEAVAEVVQRAWKRSGTSIKNVSIALPSSAVITKRIIMAAGLRDDEMEEQVRMEASHYIPFALEEVNLDFQILGTTPTSDEELDVLIAASRKERVEDRVAAVESVGLKVAEVDVESFAILAAFELIEKQLPGKGKDQVIALVDIGANAMTLTALRNREQVYSREQAFGGNQLTQEIVRHYGMSFEEAEALKRSGNLPEGYESELLEPFVENIALEVSRALQFFFTSTQYSQVHHIVLSGGCAVIPGVDAAVAGRTQVNTIIANPFANMSHSDRIRGRNLLSDSSSMMVACGLALRRFEE